MSKLDYCGPRVVKCNWVGVRRCENPWPPSITGWGDPEMAMPKTRHASPALFHSRHRETYRRVSIFRRSRNGSLDRMHMNAYGTMSEEVLFNACQKSHRTFAVD